MISRLSRLAGRTLGELAAVAGAAVPAEPRRAKGWAGQLLELLLGASAGGRAEPDFPALGVELKTLPVDERGRPRESTFVATLDLERLAGWEASPVRAKLRRVAFLPVLAGAGLPLHARRLGSALLWSPDAAEEAALRADYEEIVELLEAGFGHRVTGHRGAVLQLRPKGANAAALRRARDEEGAVGRSAPRAFYLRAGFTGAILARRFGLPSGG